jgi:hypothetical protein
MQNLPITEPGAFNGNPPPLLLFTAAVFLCLIISIALLYWVLKKTEEDLKIYNESK